MTDRKEVDELRGIISDLQSRLERFQNPVRPGTADYEAPKQIIPFWDVVAGDNCSFGVDLIEGVGDDWSDHFDPTGAVTNRTTFRLATAGGEICTFGTHELAYGKRFSIQFDADHGGEITYAIAGFYTEAGDTDYTVQVKLNGIVTEYNPSAGRRTLTYSEGRNSLVLTYADRPILVTFMGTIFDGKTRRWVDPRDFEGYRP